MCRNGRRGGLKIPCANNTCGFDPHHRHKKEALQLVWGAFFLSAACERVEQHDPAQQGSNQPCGLLLSARETPTTGIKRNWLILATPDFLAKVKRKLPPRSLSFDAFHLGPPNLISRNTKALPLGCEQQGFVMRLFLAANRDKMLPRKLCGAARWTKTYSAMGMVW